MRKQEKLNSIKTKNRIVSDIRKKQGVKTIDKQIDLDSEAIAEANEKQH
jgi:hypothetical protein